MSKRSERLAPLLALAAGDRVDDRYVLHAKIGSGATGEVWRATHAALTREYAIKFLRSNLVALDDSHANEVALRFRFEAQVCCRLGVTTAHIVAVHDAGVFRGGAYMVMDLVRGSSVSALLKRGPMEWEGISSLLRDTATALDACHASGLAHRDTKPANILLDDVGRYRLADFGLAKFFGDAPADILKPRETTGEMLIGTPAYMSPEAISGQATLDGRGDVWSLAVTLYECLTHKLPFQGEAWPAVAVAIMKRRYKRPSERDPALGRFDDLFEQAFALDIDQRFQAPRDLIFAFEQARGPSLVESSTQTPHVARDTPIEESPVARRPTPFDAAPTRRTRSRMYWRAAIVMLGLVLGVAVALQLGVNRATGDSTALKRLSIPALDTSPTTAPSAPLTPPPASRVLTTPAFNRAVSASTSRSRRSVDPSEVW